MRKRKSIVLWLIIILAVIGLGYAFLFTDLHLIGTARLDRSMWSIHWSSIEVLDGSVTTGVTAPHIMDHTNDTKIEFAVNSLQPGEYYEFVFEAENDGTFDAMIDSVTLKVNNNESIPNYLLYLFTYDDGYVPVEIYDVLKAGESEFYRVRIEYNPEIDDFSSTDITLSLELDVNYVQADSTAAVSLKEEKNYMSNSYHFVYGDDVTAYPLEINYATPEDAMSYLNTPFYLVGVTRKNILTNSLIGIHYNDTDCYLDDKSGMEAYENRRDHLMDMFGDELCSESYDNGEKETSCLIPNDAITVVTTEVGISLIYQNGYLCILAGEKAFELGMDAYCGVNIFNIEL